MANTLPQDGVPYVEGLPLLESGTRINSKYEKTGKALIMAEKDFRFRTDLTLFIPTWAAENWGGKRKKKKTLTREQSQEQGEDSKAGPWGTRLPKTQWQRHISKSVLEKKIKINTQQPTMSKTLTLLCRAIWKLDAKGKISNTDFAFIYNFSILFIMVILH